jgi:hypothetical protein
METSAPLPVAAAAFVSASVSTSPTASANATAAVTAAAGGAAAAAVVPSSVSAADGWFVPGGSTSFRSFYTAVCESGLGVVQSAAFDAPTLYRIACEAVSREEVAATGFLLVQAVALVQCWVLTNKRDPLQHRPEVLQFGKLKSSTDTVCVAAAVHCLNFLLTDPHAYAVSSC